MQFIQHTITNYFMYKPVPAPPFPRVPIPPRLRHFIGAHGLLRCQHLRQPVALGMEGGVLGFEFGHVLKFTPVALFKFNAFN